MKLILAFDRGIHGDDYSFRHRPLYMTVMFANPRADAVMLWNSYDMSYLSV